MDHHNLCLGCMEDKGVSQTCPHCGYSEGAAPESLLHLPPSKVLQNKYLLGRVLGQGGFGITYLAWDKTLNIKLAIKEYLPQQLATRSAGQYTVTVYKSSLAEEFNYGLNKFLEEARTLARFNEHPNIVTVRDYFEANNTAYLVMNYHEGVTLQKYLTSKGGKISVEQALLVFMPVMDALKEVHAEGILHRDISPDNLLIDKNGRVILIDFGAARQAMGEKSKSLSVIMKAGYSPPEQYQSRGKPGP
jgi:serine/threonine protein kinase